MVVLVGELKKRRKEEVRFPFEFDVDSKSIIRNEFI